MSRIDATVTARDPGGKFTAAIDKDPIHVPPGRHEIVITLDDRTTSGPTTYDTANPVYYANGKNCPASGKNSHQIKVVSCTADTLTLGDDNDGPGPIGYRLNFKYATKKEDLDPIIING